MKVERSENDVWIECKVAGCLKPSFDKSGYCEHHKPKPDKLECEPVRKDKSPALLKREGETVGNVPREYAPEKELTRAQRRSRQKRAKEKRDSKLLKALREENKSLKRDLWCKNGQISCLNKNIKRLVEVIRKLNAERGHSVTCENQGPCLGINGDKAAKEYDT